MCSTHKYKALTDEKLLKLSRAGNSCIVDIEINTGSRSFVNL